MQDNLILNFDEFLRSIEIKKGETFSLLLGAGASISSGIQSAYDCIWEWKTRIYFANNPNASSYLKNYKLEQVKSVIQKWLDSEGTYLPLDHPDEYSFYVEKCYPIADDRRSYFQQICEKKEPSIGYKLICLLAEAGIIQSVWTTNFDGLTIRTGHITNTTVIDISLDSVDRIFRAVNKNELLHVGLHGDYKYGELKNTEIELQQQDNTFRERLINYLIDKHLIVIGYSGRDNSLMTALTQVYSEKGAGRLYWCGFGSRLHPSVENLIRTAKSNNRTAFFISSDGFDDTMVSISRMLLKDDDNLFGKIENLQSSHKKHVSFTPFLLQCNFINSIIKSNSFQLKFPQDAITFEMQFENDEKPWATVREAIVGKNIQAVPYKGLVWAFGTISDIQQAFGGRIKGRLLRQPIGDRPLHQDTAIYSLVLYALISSLSSNANLLSDGKSLIWKTERAYTKNIGGTTYNVHKAIRLAINFDTEHYLTLLPDFKVLSSNQDKIPKEVLQEIGRTYFEKIYNNKFNDYINEWRNCLFNNNANVFNIEFPVNSGSGFMYQIRKSPAFAKIMKAGSNSGVTIDYNSFPQALIKYSGIQFPEPELMFAPANVAMTNNPTDFHPMRGLINNAPFDRYIPHPSTSDGIELCVICPRSDSNDVINFLSKQNQRIPSQNINKDYLLDYPGFHAVYKTSINIPPSNTDSWELLDEPAQFPTIEESCLRVARSITTAIETLRNKGRSSVVVIYIPQRWNSFTSFSNESEHFDLHDYVKAFAAPSGITTQFIQEDTLRDQLQCQIHWWLSLSFYVKSFRTPWILGSLDKQTAFAGIGYSTDHSTSENHIVLGCSHIYNSQGEGLKYKLSKVEEPIWDKQKNPHLSYNDAFKFGLSIQELFFSSMRELPKRVVVHKRTYFTQEEIYGIKDSLFSCGIEKVDLIEISYEDNIRYIASKIVNNTPKEPDSFPRFQEERQL
jgi:hypothetical protein